MKKSIAISIILLFILSIVSSMAVGETPRMLSSQRQLESQLLEDKETLVNPTMVAHVIEIYGTIDEPH